MKWLNLQDNINLITIISAIALVVLTFVVVGNYIKKMKDQGSKGELSETSHDGIGEYKNDLPIGWAACYVLLIAWAIWYFLVGYPLNSYSQIGEYNEEVKAYNAKFEEKFKDPSKETLLAMGKGIYLVECVACHGISGSGMNGKAQDLSLWGSEKGIIDSIVNGAKGLEYPMGEMPAGMADEESAKSIAAFIAKDLSAIKETKNEDLVQVGKDMFAVCAACHGEDGKGMDGMSPDLTLYGSPEFVVDVLNRGKHGFIGTMPAFNDGRLSEIQKRAVGEYVISLSRENLN